MIAHGHGALWGGLFAHADPMARTAANLAFKRRCAAKRLGPWPLPNPNANPNANPSPSPDPDPGPRPDPDQVRGKARATLLRARRRLHADAAL